MHRRPNATVFMKWATRVRTLAMLFAGITPYNVMAYAVTLLSLGICSTICLTKLRLKATSAGFEADLR